MKTTTPSISTTCSGKRTRPRRGQTIIFFMMVLVILAFVVIWNFDLHKILYVKSLTQNGGDSAAVMAARWQGIALNMIGDMNVMHAIALSNNDEDTAVAITNIQARICFVGPMIAFMASQQAAKNNGLYRNTDFDDELHEHAERVRNDYPQTTGPNGLPLFPEPYEGCWAEYADMLDFIADQGVAAAPDNARYYTDDTGGHILRDMGFYEAIASQNWCWFHWNAPNLLTDYRNFFPCWWPPLPPPNPTAPMNSEIYSLGLAKFTTRLNNVMNLDEVNDIAVSRDFGASVNSTGMQTAATWYCYGGNRWTEWTAMDPFGDDPFPTTGTIKEQYDYAGADAAVRVEAVTDRLTPGANGNAQSNTITWTSAAKPFGYLNDTDKPNAYGLVIPAFHDARLIPVDASSAPAGGSYNLDWRRHVDEHLPHYMANGPGGFSGCPYCAQLVTWENQSFRQTGAEWLAQHSDLCIVHGGGGGGGHGGGSRRGH